MWHPAILDGIWLNPVGGALIGVEFDWLDFPHYAAGAVLGVACLRLPDCADSE